MKTSGVWHKQTSRAMCTPVRTRILIRWGEGTCPEVSRSRTGGKPEFSDCCNFSALSITPFFLLPSSFTRMVYSADTCWAPHLFLVSQGSLFCSLMSSILQTIVSYILSSSLALSRGGENLILVALSWAEVDICLVPKPTSSRPRRPASVVGKFSGWAKKPTASEVPIEAGPPTTGVRRSSSRQ